MACKKSNNSIKGVATNSPAWSAHTLMAALIKLQHKQCTAGKPVLTKSLPPSSLANQTRVIIAWLDFSFQQPIHHNLRQIAACSSFSQGGSVVKGSHVILQRKIVSESSEFLFVKSWQVKSVSAERGKNKFTGRFPCGKYELLEFFFYFPEASSQHIKQRQTFSVFSFLLIIFIYLGNLFYGRE